jgi:hypothetical protein
MVVVGYGIEGGEYGIEICGPPTEKLGPLGAGILWTPKAISDVETGEGEVSRVILESRVGLEELW